MTILVANGCSFTYGSELNDCGKNPSNLTWSALLAHKHNMEYLCVANPGASNDEITRTTIEKTWPLIQHKKDFAVAIMWTFPNRYEFRFESDLGEKNKNWFSVSPWTIEEATQLKKYLEKDGKFDDSFVSGMEQVRKKLESKGILDFIKKWYRVFGQSLYFESMHTFKAIVFLQNYLDKYGVPYFFTFADNVLFDIFDNMPEEVDFSLQCLYEQINMDRCFVFPDNRGFYQWALENNYSVGTTHPLESAHSDASNLMEKNFVQVVQKNCSTN